MKSNLRQSKPLGTSKPLDLVHHKAKCEKELQLLGEVQAAPIHERIRAIVFELARIYPITELRMGMGSFWLYGGSIEVVCSDDSEGDFAEVSDLLESHAPFSKQRYSWIPKQYSKRTASILDELWTLCDYLTDSRYLSDVDVTEAEIVAARTLHS
jgi:hypothetical protein